MRIQFIGAISTVTGSQYLVSTENHNLLIDCGMFQGRDELEKMNYEAFCFAPKQIDAVLLTHAHIDHSGLLPKLVREGFTGQVYCTTATALLIPLLLKDAAHIQEADTEWKNRKNARSGLPLVKPLYQTPDAEAVTRLLAGKYYYEKFSPLPNVEVTFHDAGHILGSAIIEMTVTENGTAQKIVFSGDIGNPGKAIVRDPDILEGADYVVIESTYGDRNHKDMAASILELTEVIETTINRGGNVVIPAFALGRTQEFLYHIKTLLDQGLKRRLRKNFHIFVDSPLAIASTRIFEECEQYYDAETLAMLKKGISPFEYPELRYTNSVAESMDINKLSGGAIIISASGMCQSGRIRHHLKHNLWRSDSSIIFCGFQGEGSLGRRLVDGEKQVKVLGEEISVKAEIHTLGGFSAHADQSHLLSWLKHFEKTAPRVFCTHGEAKVIDIYRKKIESQLHYSVTVPEKRASFELGGLK